MKKNPPRPFIVNCSLLIAHSLLPILLLLLLNTVSAAAQDTAPFRIAAGLGCSFTGYRDEIESPINRYMNVLTYIIDGNIEHGSFLHSFNTIFFMGNPKMKSPYDGYARSEYYSYRGSTDYALDYRLWGNKTFPGFLGGNFRAFFTISGENDKESPTPPTGFFSVSLDVHVTQKWLINEKNSLVFSAAYPLLGYAIRPAYATLDEYWMKYIYEDRIKLLTLGQFTSFHNYWAFYGDLKYFYKFSPLFSLYSGLGFEISRVNFSRPRIDAIFRLYAGFSFSF